jgi:hypothetical protein
VASWYGSMEEGEDNKKGKKINDQKIIILVIIIIGTKKIPYHKNNNKCEDYPSIASLLLSTIISNSLIKLFPKVL